MEKQDEVQDSPAGWVAEHVRQYVASDGGQGHDYHGFPTLLITARGRKSGVLRRTALIYGRDGDRYIVVGSNGGAGRHPNWYANLVAEPEVGVQVKADTFTARARTAGAEERPRLWELMAGIFPMYDEYAAKAPREIPVVILERH